MSETHGEYDELDPVLEAVGRVVSASATLEWAMINLHLCVLASPRGHYAVAGEGFDRARQACLHLAHHIGSPVDELVREVVETAGRVWERRGGLVHGIWLAALGDGVPGHSATVMRMRRTGSETSNWTVQEIRVLADEINAAADRIDGLCVRFDAGGDLEETVNQGEEQFFGP